MLQGCFNLKKPGKKGYQEKAVMNVQYWYVSDENSEIDYKLKASMTDNYYFWPASILSNTVLSDQYTI